MREAFARWVSGVTVVAVRHASGISALTVSAFTPLSLRPPLVVACVGGDAPVLSYLEEVRRFTVNLLAADQRALAVRFADRVTLPGDSFESDADAVIGGAAASLSCTLEHLYEGGDHVIVVGRVVGLWMRKPQPEPLVWFDRDYRALR